MLQMKMKMQVALMRINFAPALNVLVVRKADLRHEEVVNKNFAALMKEATSFLLWKGKTEKQQSWGEKQWGPMLPSLWEGWGVTAAGALVAAETSSPRAPVIHLHSLHSNKSGFPRPSHGQSKPDHQLVYSRRLPQVEPVLSVSTTSRDQSLYWSLCDASLF